MAQLTRKFLRALGVEEDKIDEIVNAHQDTLEEIKAERDGLKDNASKLAEAQAEVTRLSGELEQAKKTGGDASRVQADFDAYKQQVETERVSAMNESDLMDIAREAGIQRESFRRMAAKTFDRERIKRGEDKAITNREELLEAMKADYPDFIATDPQPKGPGPVTPPSPGDKTYTRDQIKAMSAEEINQNWGAVKNSLASAK